MHVTKKEVEQFITAQKPDTFWTHSQFEHRAIGESSKNTIKLWQRNSWTMSLYAVFIFSFNAENHLINIKTKCNLFGKILFSGIFIALFIFLTLNVLSMYQNERFWLYTCIVISFLVIYIVFCKVVYESEKRIQRKAIFEKLDIEMSEEHTVNERSLFSIFIRIFTYPLGLATIYTSIFSFFPDGKYKLAIVGMIVVSAYFITDIILLFRKKKKPLL